MYNGKYGKRKAASARKSAALLISVIVLAVGIVAGTVAWLVSTTRDVQNTFTVARVPIEIDEDFNGDTKENVKVKNTGDVDAYIRARIVVTWQDEDGNVYGKTPVKGTDYTMTELGAGWFEQGGYYYHREKVSPNATTTVLIQECKEVADKAPEGYHLCVEILAESIQADGKTAEGTPAVTDAWGVNVDNSGKLTN